LSTTELAGAIRRHSLEMVHAANASHIGGVLSMADVLGVLYGKILRVRPNEPLWADRDRLILSKGHCCAGVYAALAQRGFIPMDELKTYGQNGSRLMTHISHKVPGVEFSTGSLGHGLPFGCGKALAAKRQGKAWRSFVILSDGELDEGSNWEAILFAPHHRLDNLTIIIDYNKIQSLGSVADTLGLDPLANKFNAFNWAVREIDGHNHAEIETVLASLPWEPSKPNCLIAHTIKGKGVRYMENNIRWHYSAPNADQLAEAISDLST